MSVRSIKTGQRISINQRGFSFWSIVQLCGMLICGMIVFIGMMFYHTHDWDVTSPENFIPSNVAKERNKVERNKEDMIWLTEKIRYAINHPIPELHTGLKKYGSVSDTNFNTAFSTINRDKFKKLKSETQTIIQYNGLQVEGSSKPKQKMIRYEDWIDEPENQ